MASEVGVRELRDHLKQYLARVRSGEVVVVTKYGRAVARLVGLERERPLDRLIAQGRVTPAARRDGSLPRRVVASGSVSDLVSEQRR